MTLILESSCIYAIKSGKWRIMENNNEWGIKENARYVKDRKDASMS